MPLGLKYGLDVFTFWEMTIKELNQYIKAIQEREKQKQIDFYLQASLTANFVGCILGGKQIPTIQEVFPETFQDSTQARQEEQDYKAMMLYKEQMIDFAKRHNKIRQAKKDGESN